MKVIISAGGTGGHIYPALAILNKIKMENPDSEFLYIGTKNRMESRIVPEKNIPYLGLDIIGLKKNFTVFKALYLFLKSIKICKKEIKKFNPDIVIGVGGYVTSPVIYSAKKLGYKTIIHEQNSISGKSNRFLTKYCDKILVSLPGSMKYFPKEKTIYTGNPRSYEANLATKADLSEYKFNNKKLVLIVMGSLGSKTINNELKNIVSKFDNKKYDVLLVTGKDYYDEFKKLDIPSNVRIVPYLDNMLNVMKNVDVMVTRAGASTIAEITSIGIPSIIVPSPYVANNHQYYNAMELVNNGSAYLLEEKDFNSDNLLDKIDLVLNDDKKYKEMKENSLKLGVIDSGDKIYNEILNVIRGR